VQGIPNMKIFAAGEEVAELIGMKSKQTLIDALEKARETIN
jgi:thioredoxin 1